MLTDSHCHLYHEYYEDLDSVFQRAKEAGVSRYIVSGCDKKSNEEILQLVQGSHNVYGCLGIHPENVLDYQKQDIKFLKAHLTDERIIGLGEIGLDYHYSKENKEEQKKLFELQLKLAEELSIPVVIHSREATEDTIALLQKYPKVKGVIHSFSLPIEVARIYIKMGYKLGINGVITFKNCNLKEIISELLPHIILETDSPYLAPHPYRGTKNEPRHIKTIAMFLSEYLHIKEEEIEKITNENIKKVFSI